MALASLKGVHTRLVQELAAHRAIRESARKELSSVRKEAPKRAAAARSMMVMLQSKLQPWVDRNLPPDPQMERYAKLYMRAVRALHDAEYGGHRAGQVLEEAQTDG
jgi:hypothetical protein